MSTLAWEPLLRRNRELAGFLAETPGGLHWLDAEGRILWASDGVLSLLGYPADQYAGHKLSDFVAPDDRSDELLRRLAEPEMLHNEVVGLRAADGVVHPVLLSSSGWWDDGLLVHTRPVGTADLRDAQKRLVESERKFRAIFDRAPEAVVITDASGRYHEANAAACALHHQGKEYLRGRSLADAVVDKAALQRVLEGLREDPHARGVLELRRPEGTVEVEYAVNARFLPGRQIWVMRDVTARRRDEARRSRLLDEMEGARTDAERLRREAEEAREEAETARRLAENASRAKDEFLATLSHELRTPLNAIVGWSHLLRTGELDRPTLERGLETIERNARAQSKLIAEILDVSRMVTGNLRLDVQPFDLREAIDRAVESIRPAATARGVHLDVAAATASELVAGDRERLQQVVWNLLSNAVKFSAPGDHVRLRVERTEADLKIVVEDTGEGLAPELLPHVFERFRQGDSSSTRRHGGLGLGLAIVRHLVELHGGTVSAESPGRGGGSRFTVTLPRLGSRREARLADEPGEAPRLDGVRVLAVDDESDARELTGAILGRQGAHVSVVASAAEALRRLDEETFDVLLVDLSMPEQDGCELLRQVRRRPAERGGRTPAAAVTAFAQPEDRMRALRAGFQMHIAKPVGAEELATVVASLAEKSS